MYNMSTKLDFQENLNYWFIPQKQNQYDVYQDGKLITVFDETNQDSIQDSLLELGLNNIASESLDTFYNYKNRPEYRLGKHFEIPADIEDAITLYETFLTGTMLAKRSTHTKVCPNDTDMRLVDKVLNWLKNTDFYIAPSSTIYHDSYVSGLLFHTLNVLQNIYDLLKLNKFKDVNVVDATCVALVHDWCKIGLYTPYKRNIKNEETGQWEQVDSFRRNTPAIPMGHGVESVYKAMKVFQLSEAEFAAIRWHMGAWNVAHAELNDLQAANEKYPLVHLLQFADQLAIVKY